MKTAIRRATVVVALVIGMFSASVPMADAAYELCPFVEIRGERYEVCVPLLLSRDTPFPRD
jgi:hypothetical protein